MIKVLRFYPFGFRDNPMIVKFTEEAWKSLWQFVEDTNMGDGVAVSIGLMNEEEFKNLPEYLGWKREKVVNKQKEEMRPPVYTFQCARCFIVSGRMSRNPDDAPRCCGGEKMTPVRIHNFREEAKEER